MTDQDQPDGPAPSSAKISELVDDYQRQQEAWCLQAREIARLKAQVLGAARHEAAGIVTTARAEIGRVIVDARRDLAELAAQIHTITNIEDEPKRGELPAPGRPEIGPGKPDAAGVRPAQGGIDARGRLLDAGHDVLRALEDAKHDLDRLGAGAPVVRLGAQPKATDEQPDPDKAGDLPTEIGAALETRASAGRLARAWVVALILISLATRKCRLHTLHEVAIPYGERTGAKFHQDDRTQMLDGVALEENVFVAAGVEPINVDVGIDNDAAHVRGRAS